MVLGGESERKKLLVEVRCLFTRDLVELGSPPSIPWTPETDKDAFLLLLHQELEPLLSSRDLFVATGTATRDIYVSAPTGAL